MALEPIRIPHHPLVRTVAGALRGRCGVPGGSRVLVAVSGGADSVALLRIFSAIAPRRSWQLALTVGHIQHHLRPDAEADARFTAALADDLGLPFLRADLDPGAPKRAVVNSEAWARRERYRALGLMARSAAAPFVVTAHHADDQLETLLMRVLRGTSVRGLAGIPWRRPLARGAAHAQEPVHLIRPMLGADRAGIRAFLRDLGQTWLEDASNRDLSRLRAALRLEVVPRLTALRPDAPARAVRLGDHLRQVGRLLEGAVSSAADRVMCQPGRDGGLGQATIDRAEARTLPVVVLAGLLRRLLREAGVPRDRLSQRKLGPVLRAVRDRTGGRRIFALGCGIRACVGKNSVRITGPSAGA